jgi:hypothetical protein
LALGTSGTQLKLNGNHATLHVIGGIVVNSNATGAVSSNSSNFSYGSLQIVGPGTCSTCPAGYTTRSAIAADPLAFVAVPDETGLPVFTDGNPAHGPGVYRGAAMTFPNGQTTVLATGLYIAEAAHRNMFGPSGSAGARTASVAIACIAIVVHGFSSGLIHTDEQRRPPGSSTRASSAVALAMSGKNM